MLIQDSQIIKYSSIFIYIKQRNKIFKGYWIWDNRLSNLKNKLIVELLYNHGTNRIIYDFILMINKTFTLNGFKLILKKLNDYFNKSDSGYSYYLYCNAMGAINEVKRHNGDIFIDYYKTIEEDCLMDK